MNKLKPYWLSQANMARSCGVSLSAFQKWNVRRVAKIGRIVYYRPRDVTNNRVDNLMIGRNSDMAKFDPAIAEYARQRIDGLEARIAEMEAQIEAGGKS